MSVGGRLARLVGAQWRILAGAVGLLCLLMVLEATVPYVLKIALDDHIAVGVRDGLLPVALLFAGGLIARGLVAMALARTLVLLGQRAMHDLRCKLHAHVLTRSHAYFDRTPLGGLLMGITADVEAVGGIFAGGVVTLFVDLIVLVAIIATMLYLSPALTAVTLGAGLILIPLFAWARGRMRTAYRDVRANLATLMSFVVERISGVAAVQAYGGEHRAAREHAEKVEAYRRSLMAAAVSTWTPPLITDAVAMIAGAVVVYYSATRIDATLTVGLVVAFVEYANRVFGPLQTIAQKYGLLQGASAAGERIFALLDDEDADAPVRTSEAHPSDAAIELRSITFGYRPGTRVIDDVSFRVPHGATVAIVGATGSGKSTLVRLLARHYEPQAGAIYVDGRDVRAWPIDDLRSELTVIAQDVFLFSGTVADNVRIGRPEASLDDVTAALRRVGAPARLLEEGLHAQVGERGANLSTGERQLVAFARALVRDPRVLLLDEATANVDPETEQVIERAIISLFAGRTCLIVAHRLSTIRRADLIVVMADGKIVETGTRAELLRAGGAYARLEATGGLADHPA